MMKKIIIAALTIAAMAGCTKDEGFDSYSSSDNIVNFSSQSIGTRTNDAGTEWEATDQIGITSVGFANDYANVAYEATSTAATTAFSPVEGQTQILYPNVAESEGKTVDFYAYYPYDANVGAANIATIDISDQDDLGAIDFMTAVTKDNEYYVDKEYSDIVFTFSHNLAQVIFSVSLNEGGSISSLEALTARLENIETQGAYYTYGSSQGSLSGDLASVDDVDLEVSVIADDEATITAILHPANYTGSATESGLVSASTPTLIFELGGTEYIVTFDTELGAGDSHTFAVTLGFDSITLGSPTITPWVGSNEGSLDYLDASEFDIAYNSVSETYQIYTAAGLKAFANLVNGTALDESVAYAGDSKYFVFSDPQAAINAKLMDNIDLSSVCYEVDGSTTNDISWTPIGDYTSISGKNTTYSGIFDGNGFEVKNMYININSSYQALFGSTNGATIKDLGVSGSVAITGGYSYISGIVGYAYSSSIIGCYNTATISGNISNYQSGVVGDAVYSTIIDCYNTGNISSSSNNSASYFYAGGVVGRALNSEIIGCYNTGDISSSIGYVGGVVGYANTSSSSSTTVTGCYNMGSVKDGSSVGGVVGYASTTSTTVTSCYSAGAVSGSSSVGGVVGRNYSSNSLITYCYYDKSVATAVSYAVGGTSSSSSGDIPDTDNVKGLSTDEMTGSGSTLLTGLQTGATGYWFSDTSGINDYYPILSWQVE